MSNNIKLFSIRTLTNMHVGSGSANEGVIDNLVQRDTNTNMPTIHASSLKGALKEFFRKENPSIVKHIFGSNPDDKADDIKPGAWSFMQADMISRPVRSDKGPWLNAISPHLVDIFVRKLQQFGFEANDDLQKIAGLKLNKEERFVFNTEQNGACIEEENWTASVANFQMVDRMSVNFLGENPVVLQNGDLQKLQLPVIARNVLENGESKNLWYEEVVPFDTRFAFIVIIDDDEDIYNQFIKGLDKPVQIGANASIGYGLSKIDVVDFSGKGGSHETE